MKTRYVVMIDGQPRPVTVEAGDGGNCRVALDDEVLELEVDAVGSGEYLLRQGHEVHDLLVRGAESEVEIHGRDFSTSVQLLDERDLARQAVSGDGLGVGADGMVTIEAPMPGRVVKCLVREGDAVSAGQGVIVVEAMKMENELRSAIDGTVRAIAVAEGDGVEAGALLVTIEAGSVEVDAAR
jgi:biotin carboxyl carrier protein